VRKSIGDLRKPVSWGLEPPDMPGEAGLSGLAELRRLRLSRAHQWPADISNGKCWH